MSAGSLLAKFTAGQFGLGKIVSVGMGGVFSAQEYSRLREEGHGAIASFAGAAFDFGLSTTMGVVPYMAFSAVRGAGELAVSGMNAYSQYSRDLQRQNLNIPFANSTFIDSPQIQTMRQAGLALARQSKARTQEAMMGNEAQYLHR